MKILRVIDFENEIAISTFPSIRFFETRIDIDELNDTVKQNIKNEVSLEKDFTLDVSTLKELKNAHNKRVDNLLKHLEFNPFKEDLRKNDKEEYSYYPFEWRGTRYYLYPRMGFEIDRDIERSFSFIKLLEAQIDANKPLIFKFNEQPS